MQDNYRNALKVIMDFELTLRKVARFELMKAYGRHWLVSASSLYDTIEARISYDTKAGLYDNSSSELSYLSLNELSELIFKSYWKNIFCDIFNNHFSYLGDIHKKISPLRNKVAHFRVIQKSDLYNAKVIVEVLESLKKYYMDSELTLFHISSDPCYAQQWIDFSVVDYAFSILKNAQHDQIWSVLSEGDSLRKYGYSIGAGIYNGHFFLEFFNDSGYPVSGLDNYLNKNKEAITFISLISDKLRVFYSLANDQKENSRLIKGLFRVLASRANDNYFDGYFEISVGEYFVGPTNSPTFSFAI